MKFRTAKKILLANKNAWRKKFLKLRPPYLNERGNWVYPSRHDFSVIRKALKVYLHHVIRKKKRWN